jgi:hypothetical protein
MAAKPGPAKLDITLYRGVTFKHKIQVVDADGVARNLTGYTARMQIREDVDDSNIELTVTPTISGVAGEITIEIDNADTASLTVSSAVWDLLIDSSGIDET